MTKLYGGSILFTVALFCGILYFRGGTMDKSDKLELVVKSNDLIRKTRYSLSEQEQKIIIYLISKIKADDKEFNRVELSISEFCRISNIRHTGTTNKSIKKHIKVLSDKSWWITIGTSEVLFRWIENVEINKGIISLKLSEFLKPFLLDLKNNFTKYELINVLVLRGKYSIRLYEILKSYLWQKGFTISLEELKQILQCPNYKTYKDFRIRILDYSLKEINEYTDIEVQYKPIKQGKRIVSLEFTIIEKKGVQIAFDTVLRQIERLGE